MNTDRRILALVAVAAACAAVQPAQARICINTRDIVSSTPSDDGKSITFQMKNGHVLRNDLQNPCPNLKFNGFAWTLRNQETVCDEQQGIRVLRSGETCLIGKFSEVSSPPKPAR